MIKAEVENLRCIKSSSKRACFEIGAWFLDSAFFTLLCFVTTW